MRRLKDAVVTSTVRGFIAIASPLILYFTFAWLFGVVVTMIAPLTSFLLTYITVPKWSADIIVIVLILATCFFTGNALHIRLGKFFHDQIEKCLKKFPLYGIIKGTLVQILGKEGLLSRPIAIAYLSPELAVIVLLVEDHGNGWCTVFYPTAPNPTTGFMLHLPMSNVKVVPGATKEMASKTILTCGIGSRELFRLLQQNLSMR